MRTSILAASACVLVAGCTCGKTVEEIAPREPTASSTPADDGFLYAPLAARRAPAPARFEAELPSSMQAFTHEWSDDFPPPTYVRDRLCGGDPAMGDRFARAVDEAAAHATPAQLESAYGRMIEFCARPSFCAWAAAQVSNAARSAPFRTVVWVGLARCPHAVVDPLIARPGVPARAVVHYQRDRIFADLTATLPVPDGFLDAVRTMVQREGDYDADHEASFAIDTLARMRGGAGAIVALSRELPAQRDRIGLALWNASDPQLVRLHAAACAHRPDASGCEHDRAPREPEHTAVAITLSERVRSYDFDVREHLASHPDERAAVLDALEACAREASDDASGCIASLAREDWARARTIALSSPPPTEGHAGEALRTLRTYETPDALGRRLVEVGLLRTAPAEPCLSVEDALSAGGVITRFDTETGQFPNEHDSLLRELAALAPDALPGVLFVELAPGPPGGGLELDDGTSLRPDSLDESAGEEGPYTLVAYLDGEELRTSAENLGDWYDVGAVVGMLNTLARRRGEETRWEVLPTGDQTAIVLAAPGPAIRRAMREGLIEGAGADDARSAGREFEERAMEALRRQGL